MNYGGYRSLTLENETIRVVVVPEVGAKIVSLFDKRAGREWLVTPEQSNSLRPWPYGAGFDAHQSGGWDEMFPTIVACAYPGEGPYFGAALPDHGEAWTLPWALSRMDAGSTESQIALELRGRALPYRLCRGLALADDALILTYSLENLGEAPFAYIWAAHPQFACEAGARIVLPATATEVINALPAEWGPEFGPEGTRNRWPEFAYQGRAVRQDQVAGPEKRGGRKFYLPPDGPIAWGELRQPGGDWLRMSWDVDSAPYCGVWIDEGYLNTVSDMAFEPTTGFYDSLVVAWENQRCAMIAPAEIVRWELKTQLGRGE